MKSRTIIMLLAGLAWLIVFVNSNAASADAETQADVRAKSNAAAKEPFLGVTLDTLHPALALHLADVIGKGRGVLVTRVAAGSPADKAGIHIHDILVTYDKQDLYSAEQLSKLVRNDDPQREVTIGFVHAGRLKEAMLRLEESPTPDGARRHTTFRFPFNEPPVLDRFGWVFSQPRQDVASADESDQSHWKSFESLTIKKVGDGQLQATIQYVDSQGKSVSREFSGTPEEIRGTLIGDNSLPREARNHLLRSFSQRSSFEFLSEMLEKRLNDAERVDSRAPDF